MVEGSKTILVVDDEASVRQFINYALQTAGYNILLAADLEGEKYYYPVRCDVGGICGIACGGVSEMGRGWLFDKAL